MTVKSGSRDQTALHIAAGRGNIEISRLVLKHGYDVNAADNTGFAPINQAAIGGHFEVTKMLIYEYKADLTAVCFDGLNLLHLAVLSGDSDLVLDLGVKPAISSKYGYNVLHTAAVAGSLGML